MDSGLCNAVRIYAVRQCTSIDVRTHDNVHTDNSGVAHPITATQYVLEHNGQNSWSMAQN
jgi:hypothetical protein